MPSEEFQILKQQSLYSRLKRLFSTDVIVRNVGGKKLKIVDTDQVMYATDRNTLRDRFNRIRTSSFNQYSRDFTLSYQAARVELFRDYDCVGPDTIIPLPDGSRPTIAELTEKYKDKPKERFHVFSYDHETDSIKLGNAYHPRKKGHRMEGYKVTFDDGKFVIGSENHPFLMRNGEYKVIKDLQIGESVMPFYQHTNKLGYRSIYNYSHRWVSEHKLIATQFYGAINENECVHHKNFKHDDNSPSNLEIMLKDDHKAFHANHNKNVLWGDENYENQLNKMKSHPNYVNREFHHWDGERSGKNNPFFGKTHSDESNEKRSKTLKEVFVDRDQTGEKNPKYRGDLTVEILKIKATEHYKNNGKLTAWGLVKDIGCDYSVLQNRLKDSNTDWSTFKNDVVSTLNHKIVSIEMIGETDVYDITVEKYHNFATDSIISHNTMDMDPILASALDIYADECVTKNELGKILTVTTDDNNIKQILENLFYDILNIEFFLWSWTRNLVKYGDFYLKLYISPEYGVYLAEPISSYSVTRVENSDINNKNYTKFQINLPEGGKIEDIENYQMAHFRLLSDSNFLPYGKCLVGETHVDTEFGSKYIKDLLVGEKIWSFNINNGLFELTSVKNKINSGVKETIKITTEHNFIESSKNHPILIFCTDTNLMKYKQSSDIKIGDLLVINSNKNSNISTIDNTTIVMNPVVNIEFTGEKETWDIQVESENSNFVANGVVVHNSMIEGARRVWKQLSLMEDAMLIHRVIRAPEKRIFKIDVGNIPPQEVDQYIEKIINKTKKIPYIDPNTGDYNLRYNIQNLLEDFYLPVRGSDSGTSIEPLSGMEFTGIDDIEYLRNKMLAALKIPKAFLGYEEDLCLVPETVIPTLGGKDKTIKQLIEDYDNGIKNYVYSIDETTKNIVTGEVEWAGYTRKNAKLIRVHLDNSKYIDCTPDHNFMTRDGLWVEAQNLKPNQSLMPLYRKNEVLYGKSNYEMVYNPGLNSWEWTHKLVDNHTHGGNVSQPIPFNFDTMIVRHHKDFNRFNNDPTNIERVTNKNHKQIHNENVYKTFCSPEAIDYKKSKEFRDKKRNERLSYIKNNPHTKDKLKKNLAQYNLSNEELSIRCKNAWIEDDGTRLNKLVADNKKHNKSLRMIKALRIKKGFVNSLPTFEELVQFVKTNKIDNKKVIAKSLGCGYKYIENLIYSNGFNSIPEFYNEILGFKSGRTLSVRSQYYTELLNQYKSIDNIGITFGLSKNQIKSFSKKQTPILNHKVIKVEFLVETKDTCDLRITKYHNFATAAGVIVHNSGKATLASEDVRFAKTVNRIQKILVSELKKIAIVHLYAQGYTDESLVNFDLELTNPSVILEAEKVKIWSDKVALAKDMVENKLFSRKWIYNNVFKLADQDVDEQKNDIIEDAKDNYRFKQIEEEGIDPSKPFNKIKSDGESAESSSEGGGESSEEGGGSSDSGISGGEPIPKEVPQETPPAEPTLTEKSKRPSQAGEHKYRKDTRFGYDPMGNKENTRISKTDPLRSASKSKSPLSLENLTGLRAYLQSHAETKKDLLKEAPSKSLLDESNIIVDE